GTYAEKTIWGMGGGEGLRVFPTELGKMGGLICGENFDNLARQALALEGAIPNYPIHDRVGYHGRPDVFRLLINREAYSVPLSQHPPVEEA
ncbi:MAG: hypothetical protein ACE5JU_18225, partial [Candidatus Binatia bacterium]